MDTARRTLLVNVDPRLAELLDAEAVDVDLLDEEACRTALAGADAIVVDPLAGEGPVGRLLHSTRGLWNLLHTAPGALVVQLSTMRLMDAHDPGWQVSERFVPRPADEHDQLCHHLAELTSREVSREVGGPVRVLRLDDLTTTPVPGSTELHVEDAAEAITSALHPAKLPAWLGHWSVLHIVHGRGRHPLGWARREPFSFSPRHPGAVWGPRAIPTLQADGGLTSTPVAAGERIVVLGAGGPLGAAVAEELAPDHRLVLIDRDPITDAAARTPQSPGAPVAIALPSPHRHEVADIADLDRLADLARGANALVNVAVARESVASAFWVNVVGAWTMGEVARRAGITRLVLCGPTQGLRSHPVGYFDDAGAGASSPARPGANLYFLTKLLGQELLRVQAGHRDVATPVLLFDILCNPRVDWPGQCAAHLVSWADAARAVRAALEVDRLPEAAPVINVCAPAPHGRVAPSEATMLLGWEPQDSVQHQWWHEDHAARA